MVPENSSTPIDSYLANYISLSDLSYTMFLESTYIRDPADSSFIGF